MSSGADRATGSLIALSAFRLKSLLGLDLKGVWLCMKYEIPHMLKQGGGAIVNTSSMVGLVGSANASAYVAAKHGVLGLTKTAAIEYAKLGIRVNAVCPEGGSPAMMAPYMPPGVDIEKISAYQQRILSFQRDRRIDDRIRDIANTILFLASDESLSVTGTEILIDSGNAAGSIIKGTPGS